ncbi:MAG: ribonuclease P protein component [Rickettsia endosymbiont of Bryobia graminum]|nr:ribonuclease P protein component [Rickettsia endosymbiont of Bryobia graminum]
MLITSLKNQKEFDLVNKSGKKFHCPYFLTIIAKNSPKVITYLSNKRLTSVSANQKDSNVFYFGMKVGKKLGNAVTRNKIKRRIRHLVTLIVNDTNRINTQIPNKKIISKRSVVAQHNWAIIIIPRKNFEQVEFATLLYTMEQLLLGM